MVTKLTTKETALMMATAMVKKMKETAVTIVGQ